MLDKVYRVERFGHEQEPVVVIDNFTSNFQALRQDAASRSYQKLGPFYPGIRAQANPAFINERMPVLKEILTDVFGFHNGAQLTECAYSLVTTARNDLTPIQRLPHYDGTDEGRLAFLHYLSPEKFGGTAFFRHKGTGFETITDGRFQAYKSALEKETAEIGLPPQNYINQSSRQFEMIGCIKAKPNRCILYRGITLHSGQIPDDLPLDTNPETGRLTINIFLSKD
jgi:hypothetical protein